MTQIDDALKAFNELKQYVEKERSKVVNEDLIHKLALEDEFMQLVENALSTEDQEQLKTVMEEMRGLSHYFGAYCSSAYQLDRLTNALYSTIQDLYMYYRQG